MSSKLKSKKLLKLIALLAMSYFLGVSLFFFIIGTVWTDYDYKVLDLFYKQAVKHGYGPELSSQVVYVTITDGSYNYFGKNILDRKDMARVNNTLSDLGVEAVAYDVIFARPSDAESDHAFSESIDNLGSVYLPIGFEVSDKARPFRWEEGAAYERFRADYLREPIEKGLPHPFYAVRSLMQLDSFAEAAFNSGHISAYVDPDGVYRHVVMLLRVDNKYFPTLSLSLFLDYARVPFEEIIVEWGKRLLIPATKDSFLEKDVIIPIDDRGRAFVPFGQVWNEGFKKMEAHSLLEFYKDEDLRGNLTEFFEGNFVLIGDVSIGTADLGQTPLEGDVPLIILHSSMLNGMLSNTFYSKWSFWQVIGLIAVICLLLGASALPRSSWFLYITGTGVFMCLVWLTWEHFIGFHLFPIVSVGSSTLFILVALIISLEAAGSKDRAFIKNAFSRYVPQKVVDELLSNPESLQLGGEERVITVLFSDLANFTSISEKMSPPNLVKLLNEYLTEMTDLVLANDGIIDKYQGDAIMAEFGAPLPIADHADKAVITGLKMQRRLRELRQTWSEKGLPEMKCRVGINTGPMIIGNIGSHQVFDFTVIGDSVNLASRLEGANKRYDTYLMISESTYQHLTEGRFKTRALDVIKVKGKTKAVKVFEVYGEVSEIIDPDYEKYCRAYHDAFEAYLSKDFVAAKEKFQTALSLHPDDPASIEIIARMRGLKPKKLPPDWDGSITLKTK